MTVSAANRLNLDYRAEAKRFRRFDFPIVDIHSHIIGPQAAQIYMEAARLYGIGTTFSMSQKHELQAMRDIFGESIQFIAMPNFQATDLYDSFGKAYIKDLEEFARFGCKIVKFWAAPRVIDMGLKAGRKDLLVLNAPQRVESMQAAYDMGMSFMVHVGDPDTWFKSRYADASVYGTKRAQYEPFEELMDRFDTRWIAAHMGGWPEDLEFLSGMLSRHSNLYLDLSATKWMVRELSKHPRDTLIEFLRRWNGRIFFGSDIVTSNNHLITEKEKTEMAMKASSEGEAFDLYASRYWALRTMFETSYRGESPIADPDLAMVDPHTYTPLDAPQLCGMSLPDDILRAIYHDSVMNFLRRS